MKTIFISGLPRSGSTLLCNILAQNESFQVTSTSGLVDILVEIRNKWDQIAEFRAMDPQESQHRKIGLLRAAFLGYFSYPKNQRFALRFDKSRSWLGHMEMILALFDPSPKVIVCVRDLRDILASIELLWRQNAAIRQIPSERDHYLDFQAMPGRIAHWMHQDGLVGLAANRVLDAIRRGYRPYLHFVDYDRLTAYPHETLLDISRFIEADEEFEYDFENVKQVIKENDLAYDFLGLHQIRPKVEPQPSKWREVIGEFGDAYEQANQMLFQMAFRPEGLNGEPSEETSLPSTR